MFRKLVAASQVSLQRLQSMDGTVRKALVTAVTTAAEQQQQQCNTSFILRGWINSEQMKVELTNLFKSKGDF